MKSSSPLRIILFVAFVDLVGFGLIIPLQAVYAERLGASGLTFGLLVGIYAAMQMIFNPILGRWSDRVGRRPVLLISIAGSVVSHLLLGAADLAHSLPLLFVARTLDGITGANVATAQAYIADVTHDEDRARGMGLFGAAFGVGFVVGPGIGAGLAALGYWLSGPEAGTSWPAFGASCISFIAFILVWRKLPEPERATALAPDGPRKFGFAALRQASGSPRLRPLLLLVMGVNFALVLLEVTFVFLCTSSLGIRERGTGLVFVYIGLLMILVQGVIVGRLSRRVSEYRVLGFAPFITAIGFVAFALVPSVTALSWAWAILIVGTIPFTLGHGLTGPNLHALISKQAEQGRQGATLGLSQSASSLARTIAPPIGGLLWDVNHTWPYLFGAGLFVGLGTFARKLHGLNARQSDQFKLAQSNPATTHERLESSVKE